MAKEELLEFPGTVNLILSYVVVLAMWLIA